MTNISRPLLGPLLFLFALLDLLLLLIYTIGADWAPLWAGARLALSDPSQLYDFEAVTRLQEPIFGPLNPRPFVYPPSTLLVLIPFSLLPFMPAMVAFVAFGGALFACAARRVGANPAVLLAPPVALVAIAGQTSFLIGALGLLALSRLRRDPISGGILIGLAAAIKPTLLILAPFALIAGGHYRALAAAAASGLTAILASLLLLGVGPWLAWFDAMPRFQALIAADPSLVRSAVTPFAFAIRFGIEPLPVAVACAVLSLCGVVLTFRNSNDVAARSAALFGGALLITPYAMNYELALLAPAVMAASIRRWRDLILPVAFGASLFATASVAGLMAAWLWCVAKVLAFVSDNSRMERGVDVPA